MPLLLILSFGFNLHSYSFDPSNGRYFSVIFQYLPLIFIFFLNLRNDVSFVETIKLH